MKHAHNFKDMTGQRYGRVVCQSFDHRDENTGNAVWRVRCDCGVVFLARRPNLITGDTRSCGCLKKEKLHSRKKI